MKKKNYILGDDDMFEKIEFKILSAIDEANFLWITGKIKDDGIHVMDWKQDDMVDDDGIVLGQVYLIRCLGTARQVRKFKKRYCYTELEYEGFRTLY